MDTVNFKIELKKVIMKKLICLSKLTEANILNL